jgi:hypothetical protein
MIISFGGIGGIFATTVFRQIDFPRYILGIYATIACQLVLMALLACTTMYFRQKNQSARLGCQMEGRVGFVYTL